MNRPFVLTVALALLPAVGTTADAKSCTTCDALVKLGAKRSQQKSPHRHIARFNQQRPKGRRTPAIDLNEVRVKLLWYSSKNRPTRDAKGHPILKVGTKVYNKVGESLDASHTAWKTLKQDLTGFKQGYKGSSPRGLPVILDTNRHVPHTVTARAASLIADVLGRKGLTVAQDVVEKPIIILEEELEITPTKPKGIDLTKKNQNKNLDSGSVVDAYGVGGGSAGPYGQRYGKGSLRREGGSPGTESAVLAALRWLKFHQSADGSWDSDAWTKNCTKGTCKGPGSDLGGADRDVGLTSLALLAFLGNGHTHRFGVFKHPVSKGLRWLKGQQAATGALGVRSGSSASLTNHALATWVFCEAYFVTKDPFLKRYAQKAVAFALKAQNPGAGWKDPTPGKTSDVEATAWMIQALNAARTARIPGLAVAPKVIADGLRYLNEKTDSAPRAARSVFLSILRGDDRRAAWIQSGIKQLTAKPPSWPKGGSTKGVDFGAWYHGAHAMFQHGGADWKTWNKAMQSALLPNQRRGKCEDGSWDAVGAGSKAGGRVYTTALGALTLEVYYRLERVK